MIDILGFLRAEYKPGPGEFLEIDRQKLVEKLNIRSHGKERGALGLPSPTSNSLDEHETEICEAMRAVAISEERRTHDQLTLYQQRLQAADPHGTAADMNAIATQAVSGFEAEALAAKSALEVKWRGVEERKVALQTFKTENRLTRPAKAPKNHVFAFGMLAVFFLIETAPNAVLFGAGDEMGYLGGYTIAIVFSILNLFFGFAVGRWGLTNLQHVKLWRRYMGAIVVFVSALSALTDNIAVALVRQHVGESLDSVQALRQAFQDIRSIHVPIDDALSIALACLGLVFSFFSGRAGYGWEDPYPGYTEITEELHNAEKAWTKAVEQRLTLLDGVQHRHVAQLKAARASLRDRQDSIPDILAQRARLIRNFSLHIKHLEGVGRYALSAYRDANRAARAKDVPAPDRFDEPWFIGAFELGEVSETPASSPIDWQAANTALEASMTKLQAAYQASIDDIRQMETRTRSLDLPLDHASENSGAASVLAADGRAA